MILRKGYNNEELSTRSHRLDSNLVKYRRRSKIKLTNKEAAYAEKLLEKWGEEFWDICNSNEEAVVGNKDAEKEITDDNVCIINQDNDDKKYRETIGTDKNSPLECSLRQEYEETKHTTPLAHSKVSGGDLSAVRHASLDLLAIPGSSLINSYSSACSGFTEVSNEAPNNNCTLKKIKENGKLHNAYLKIVGDERHQFNDVVAEIRNLVLPHLSKFKRREYEERRKILLGIGIEKKKMPYTLLLRRNKAFKKVLEKNKKLEEELGVEMQRESMKCIQDVMINKKKLRRKKHLAKIERSFLKSLNPGYEKSGVFHIKKFWKR